MGYRSDVYVKVHKNDEDKLTDIFREHELEFVKEHETGDYVGYFCSWLKWYCNYKDVSAINDFIQEEGTVYPRGLIAVGEDGAIEEYGECSEMDFIVVQSVQWGD